MSVTLRTAALIAVLVGAAGSLAFLLRAGHRTGSPPFVMVLMVTWVLAPFVALLLASVLAKRSLAATRVTLCIVMLVVTAGSLAVYAHDALRPPKTKAAAVFVAVPGASWLLIVVALSIAALVSRRQSRRPS